MIVLVAGTGGVGGYFGARLAASGHEVTFLARGAHAAAIRKDGLTVDAPDGRMLVRARVIEHIDEAAGLGADLALVTVKAKDLPGIAKGVGAALGPAGVAVPLLNGLDSEQDLARVIGSEHVVGGIAQIAAELVGPGHVLVRAGARIVLAPLSASGKAKAEALAADLGQAGVPCSAEGDLAYVLWSKLLWNAPFNAICALTGMNAGDVLKEPRLEALVRDAMREVVDVAKAEGVSLGDRAVDAMIAVTRTMYGVSEPSMLIDVRAGRPTEVDALQGAVVSRGERHRVPTPIHRTLVALVLGLTAPRPNVDAVPAGPSK